MEGKMKRLPAILFAAIIVPAAAAASSLDDARTAAMWYLSTLKVTVAKALREKGTVAAFESCDHDASLMTKDLLAASRLSLKVTSLRIRNPKNAPTAAERQILDKLETAHLAGTLPEELVEKVKENGREKVLYVKPVLVDEQCLSCHGQFISRGVADIIRMKYPGDAATGYHVGDLRGIISITLPGS
jgi:hypothetical protein